MRRSLILGLAAISLFFTRQQHAQVPVPAAFEVHSVFPRENPPGFCQQVEPRELQALADQGWQLVSVMPFVYRNEERGRRTRKRSSPRRIPRIFSNA